MKIKSMLARLQSAMGRDDLIEQMILLTGQKKSLFGELKSAKPINLIVGYDSSPNSHTALDIAFWIAHQTRLATHQQAIVHVVYAIENSRNSYHSDALKLAAGNTPLTYYRSCELSEASAEKSATPILTPPKESQITDFEQPDRILWQARCLAEEWRACFKQHLRFGDVATQLKQVVESEAAEVLFLGCNSEYHPLIQQLGADFPCPVLGIPQN